MRSASFFGKKFRAMIAIPFNMPLAII